jgi:hypothetical protein
MPRFQPNAEQRRFVTAMAGFRFTADEMAVLIINPRTKEPINRETFFKYFGDDMRAGKQRLKANIGKRYLESLNKGEWPAIHWGLRHVHGYKEEPETVLQNNVAQTIRVEFVMPTKRGNGADDGG